MDTSRFPLYLFPPKIHFVFIVLVSFCLLTLLFSPPIFAQNQSWYCSCTQGKQTEQMICYSSQKECRSSQSHLPSQEKKQKRGLYGSSCTLFEGNPLKTGLITSDKKHIQVKGKSLTSRLVLESCRLSKKQESNLPAFDPKNLIAFAVEENQIVFIDRDGNSVKTIKNPGIPHEGYSIPHPNKKQYVIVSKQTPLQFWSISIFPKQVIHFHGTLNLEGVGNEMEKQDLNPPQLESLKSVPVKSNSSISTASPSVQSTISESDPSKLETPTSNIQKSNIQKSRTPKSSTPKIMHFNQKKESIPLKTSSPIKGTNEMMSDKYIEKDDEEKEEEDEDNEEEEEEDDEEDDEESLVELMNIQSQGDFTFSKTDREVVCLDLMDRNFNMMSIGMNASFNLKSGQSRSVITQDPNKDTDSLEDAEIESKSICPVNYSSALEIHSQTKSKEGRYIVNVEDGDDGDYFYSDVTLIDRGPKRNQSKVLAEWTLATEERTRWSSKLDALIVQDTLWILKPKGPPKKIYIGHTGNLLELD